ncbi:MAG: PilZ domain-containing protein [Desulfotignum sp.]|nr:PilZ domain-containing protein [Desulfotignum sp.]MCF8112417.1 PilZ domain-containing protein [Desulfotignum sp.]MCF8124770.1 PilZ domain-containing protein [Desulfotignum sp.]
MAGRKRTVERRKNKRYKAAKGAYAAISPNSRKLGQIADISLGGLAFSYIDTGSDHQTVKEEQSQKETIFLSSMGYYVGNLPFKTISDYEVADTPSLTSMKVRRRHVKFTDLSFKQLFDLDYYLRNNVAEQMDYLQEQH